MIRCVRASGRAIEPAVRHVAATVETLLDTIAAIESLQTLLPGIGILREGRAADDGERQRAGRNEASLSHLVLLELHRKLGGYNAGIGPGLTATSGSEPLGL